MPAQTFPELTSCGSVMDSDPRALGTLRPSNDLLDDPPALRQRMRQDGYLLLRDHLDRDRVLDARRVLCDRLAAAGHLEPGHDPMDAVAAKGTGIKFAPELALDNQPLFDVLYTGPMIELFARLLDAPVRHFDFTWVRAVSPGRGTNCHCDSVYMNRGTLNLYTAWTPMGDIDFEQGGLIVLEGSNNHQKLRQTYGMQDVDSFCSNKPDARSWGKSWGTGGSLHGSPNQIRRSIGGRWLTGEYRAGDVLIFSIFTVHASLDNHSERIRLSTDSRYQSAHEPADERWIGANPVGHSQAGKRGKIC